MPRCLKFFHSKSKSMPSQPAAARANMKEGKLNVLEGRMDFTSLLPPKWSASSPPELGDEKYAGHDTETTTSSWPTTTPNLAEVQHSKPREVCPSERYSARSATITHTSELSCLEFRPLADTNYARPFARAVLAAYRANLFPGASHKDRVYAERVVQGEGGDLVFRPSYIASNAVWNGTDPRLRRAAFAHILGVSGGECSVERCPYRGASCVACEESGVFEGCRHSHEISKKLSCGNCMIGDGKSLGCSIRHERKDSKDVHQAFPVHILREKHSKISSPLLVDTRTKSAADLLEDMRKDSRPRHPGQIGPVLNDFFVAPRKESVPSDFDIWMAMRKRAIDYEHGVLAMECRLAKLWSSVLEDELGKQKAAGFKDGR